ncbi:MAG: lipid-A-disaccharide synthase [Pseudomonadota bacterium]
MEPDSLKIYFVVGEESGDALGASLLDTFQQMNESVSAFGLAGERMKARGMQSLFDISDISVMGISAVAVQLPKLLSRINRTITDIEAVKPDILLLIDSPEFSYRVAKKIRSKLPQTKIIKYVAPSVWAWRPGRAKKIRAFIDHILTILPFEPEVLRKLEGPEASYVGHPMSNEIPIIDSAAKRKCKDPVHLVALPGSRRGEIKRLMPVIGETLQILSERGFKCDVTLPTIPRLLDEVTASSKEWAFQPKIITGDDNRKAVFEQADMALAASGTITLELALYKVPTISIYKLDGLAMRIRHLLTGWTASLPNLIADYPVVPEKFNEYAHPHYIARMVERLSLDDHERLLQLKGFDLIAERLQQNSPSNELAARKILEVARSK